jgi:hypothetical protein
MATFRRVAPMPSLFITREFANYNEALAYTRSIGANRRPLRTVTPSGLAWRVVSADLSAVVKPATYSRLPHWEKPFPSYCEHATVSHLLAHLEA